MPYIGHKGIELALRWSFLSTFTEFFMAMATNNTQRNVQYILSRCPADVIVRRNWMGASALQAERP